MIIVYKQTDLKSVDLLHYSLIDVKWHVTNWCNYKCSYCIQGKEHLNFTPEEIVIERAKNINKILEEKGCWGSLQALGGEVSFYDWTKILAVMPKVKRLFMTTNFSNKLEYFKNLYVYCNENEIELNLLCSYHETGDSFFEKLLELARWCYDRSFKLPEVTFVVDETFDFTFIDRFPDLVNLSLDFCMKILDGGYTTKPTNLINEQIKRIRDLPLTWEVRKPKFRSCNPAYLFEVGKDNFLKCRPSEMLSQFEEGKIIPKNFYCDAGINSFAIAPNGNILRCDNSDIIIGNIDNYEGITLPSSKCCSTECRLCQAVRMIRTWRCSFDPFIVE